MTINKVVRDRNFANREIFMVYANGKPFKLVNSSFKALKASRDHGKGYVPPYYLEAIITCYTKMNDGWTDDKSKSITHLFGK